MISRRSLLTALGLGAGSLFLPSLRGRGLVHAGPTDPPKRLIVIGTNHGTVHRNWNLRPTGLAGAEVADWEFPLTAPGLAFSRILTPLLQPLAKKTLVLDGLAQYSAIAAGGNAHLAGGASVFTGTLVRDLGGGVLAASGPSIDQIVAKQIARPDRIPSLEIGRGGMIYDDAGIALPGEGSPRALFDRLFGKPVAGTTSTDDDLVDANQGSVLDLVKSQYARLTPQLGADDRQKLAQHQALVFDLEKRIAGLAALKCTPPPSLTDPDPNAPSGSYKARFEAFAGLVVAALACDITRVVSIQMGGCSNDDMGAPPGDVHQLYAHHAEDAAETTPDGIEFMSRFHTYDANLVAYLASALDAIPEGAGTMLDNTLILWSSEIGSGGHWLGRMPIVMIGSAGGAFTPGRYVHYGQRLPIPGSNGHSDRNLLGPAHGKLLTAIAQGFGVSTNLTGVKDVTFQGRSIDLTGALDRLKV